MIVFIDKQSDKYIWRISSNLPRSGKYTKTRNSVCWTDTTPTIISLMWMSDIDRKMAKLEWSKISIAVFITTYLRALRFSFRFLSIKPTKLYSLVSTHREKLSSALTMDSSNCQKVTVSTSSLPSRPHEASKSKSTRLVLLWLGKNTITAWELDTRLVETTNSCSFMVKAVSEATSTMEDGGSIISQFTALWYRSSYKMAFSSDILHSAKTSLTSE